MTSCKHVIVHRVWFRYFSSYILPGATIVANVYEEK